MVKHATPCAAAAAPPRLTALRARTRQAKAGQDASGDSLLDGLLDELKADPMGVSAAPTKKRSFAGANAYRSAMPSYRPNQGGSTYGAPPPSNDDYTRAPPRLSVNDLCEEAGGAEAPTFGAESDAQFAEDEPQPDAPMAQPEHGAAAATTAAEALEEDEAAEQAQPMVVPFLQPVEQRGGLDWFQVCETDQAAEVEPPAALPVTGGKDGVPALEEDGSLHMYWLDAFEDPYNAPGTVYLFGKVASDDVTGFSSCARSAQKRRRVPWLTAARAASHRSKGPTRLRRAAPCGPRGAPAPPGCRREAAAAPRCPSQSRRPHRA